MEDRKFSKHRNLERLGLLYVGAERVDDALFRRYHDFFDPHDALQVRYEMIRCHEIDKQSVVTICRRFGISRQTFYNFKDRFEREGTAGLLWKKPGPKGPSKLTPEVTGFVEEQLVGRDTVTASEIGTELKQELGVVLHPRTIEKVLKELRSKKNS
ncbi:MAG: helix-turn-helix domain-containing protein [Anaerolineales bacterium]|nr:helix-turn-helix domain-containing protein [Anaerolineales bacterium]